MTSSSNPSQQGVLDRAAELQRARAAADEARRLFAGDPNIQGIGYGLKRRAGKETGQFAVVFHVRRKVASQIAASALGSRPIPDQIAGVPTDVIGGEIRRSAEATGNRDETAYDPLVAGCATSNAAENILWFNGFGTLGTLCMKNSVPMALSNWHVWADGGDKGDDIIQPGHPTAGDHFEGLGKVAFCGPLLGSLFEWEAPSPLTGGLYGGAAAAAIAAALSDVVDPSRRGQKATPTDAHEHTLSEQIDVQIDYPQQPIPGTPYLVKAKWDYRRRTDRTTRSHSVTETNTNPHVLLFKQLWTDHATYQPGSRVRVYARIRSAHSRPCSSYYVVAHYIPDLYPDRLFSAVLKPVACDQLKPPDHGQERVCADFAKDKPNDQLPNEIQRASMRFIAPHGDANRIIDMNNDGQGELFLHDTYTVLIPLSTRVEATIVGGVSGVILEAFHGSNSVGSATFKGAQPSQPATVTIDADAIDGVVFRRPRDECSLVRLCHVAVGAVGAQPGTDPDARSTEIRARSVSMPMCCYTGYINVPPDIQPGTWKGYLFVQIVNDVPANVPPEKAAQTIGGLIVSNNMVPNLAGCGAIMAADHLFDII